MTAAAVDRDIVSLCPVQVAHPHFDISFGCFVFGLGLFAFQSVLFGLYRLFFIIGEIDCLFLRLRDDLLLALVGFARNLLRRLTRDWVVSFGG